VYFAAKATSAPSKARKLLTAATESIPSKEKWRGDRLPSRVLCALSLLTSLAGWLVGGFVDWRQQRYGPLPPSRLTRTKKTPIASTK
jgi:hypothetical protein